MDRIYLDFCHWQAHIIALAVVRDVVGRNGDHSPRSSKGVIVFSSSPLLPPFLYIS